jgi:DMSO/TMAO reductase YedYZ molybdopterin-dependent catalytic subunit
MSDLITRRKLITTGLAGVAGVAGLAAAEKIAGRYGLIPPDAKGKYAVGTTLTYAAQRILTSHHSMAREFSRSEISKIAPVNGAVPKTELYERLGFDDFKDWRLMVDGLVARPSSYSLEELKRLPMKSQITHQACEEGWSFIAEWNGFPLSQLLNLVGVSERARYVVFYAFDGVWDSLDLADAFHPQTLMCYGMNGGELSMDHGAPLRLRVTRQLGYKSVKYLSRISVTDTMKNIGSGGGSIHTAGGYSWYVGI